MTKTTRTTSIALIAATMLALTACAPASPTDVAKSEVDKLAQAIANFDGKAISELGCDGADLRFSNLTKATAEDNSIDLPMEVTIGEVRKADTDRYGAYEEKFEGELYSAVLRIPAMASGSDDAATPEVLVAVNDGSACVVIDG